MKSSSSGSSWSAPSWSMIYTISQLKHSIAPVSLIRQPWHLLCIFQTSLKKGMNITRCIKKCLTNCYLVCWGSRRWRGTHLGQRGTNEVIFLLLFLEQRSLDSMKPLSHGWKTGWALSKIIQFVTHGPKTPVSRKLNFYTGMSERLISPSLHQLWVWQGRVSASFWPLSRTQSPGRGGWQRGPWASSWGSRCLSRSWSSALLG